MNLSNRPATAGFSLLEVMIAVAVFFIAVFAMLELTSRNLRHVRELQRPEIDIGALAAELTLTNALEEGVESGDFGDLKPDATWRRETYEVATNGLYQVDFSVQFGRGRDARESRLSILMYRRTSEGGAPMGRPMGEPMGRQ